MELIEIVLKSLTKKSDEEFCKFCEALNNAIVGLDVDDHIPLQ